ncbi:MAG: alkaline phosphatase family protein [Thermoanaerobaculia bacterium]
MWSRLLTAVVSIATLGLVAWIVVRGVLWEDRGDSVFALASAWEILVLGLLAVALVWAATTLHGRLRLATCLAVLVLLALVGLRDVLPRSRPDSAAAGDTALQEPAARTLWICVDGLSWSKVLPMVAAGRMPHMGALLETGSAAVLRSEATYRPEADRWGWWSPVIWTSLATGRKPEAHGITDFSLPDPTRPPRRNGKPRQRGAASFHRHVPAFWNVYSAFGRSVGVVGWWASWPAETIEGVMVTDRVGLRSRHELADLDPDDGLAWFGGQKGLTYPPSYLKTVAEDIGLPPEPAERVETDLYPFGRWPIVNHNELGTIYAVLWQDELYVKIAERLLAERDDLDLVTVYIEGVDVLSHQFWQYMADPEARPALASAARSDDFRRIVDRYYEKLDEYIGRVLAAAGPGTRIVLTSDHGFHLTPGTQFAADHSPFGTLLLAGDGIREGKTFLTVSGDLAHGPSVLDVLPTLLYWDGLPISDELDGAPRWEMFERSYLRSHAAVRIESYGDAADGRDIEIPRRDESDREYLERLKALGYVQ